MHMTNLDTSRKGHIFLYHSQKTLDQDRRHEFNFKRCMWEWILKHIDKDSALAHNVCVWVPPKDGKCVFGINYKCEIILHGDREVIMHTSMHDEAEEEIIVVSHDPNLDYFDLFISWFYHDMENGKIPEVI